MAYKAHLFQGAIFGRSRYVFTGLSCDSLYLKMATKRDFQLQIELTPNPPANFSITLHSLSCLHPKCHRSNPSPTSKSAPVLPKSPSMKSSRTSLPTTNVPKQVSNPQSSFDPLTFHHGRP